MLHEINLNAWLYPNLIGLKAIVAATEPKIDKPVVIKQPKKSKLLKIRNYREYLCPASGLVLKSKELVGHFKNQFDMTVLRKHTTATALRKGFKVRYVTERTFANEKVEYKYSEWQDKLGGTK